MWLEISAMLNILIWNIEIDINLPWKRDTVVQSSIVQNMNTKYIHVSPGLDTSRQSPPSPPPLTLHAQRDRMGIVWAGDLSRMHCQQNVEPYYYYY